jgi:ABC-type amino acid transport substrate-binding protein
MRTERGTAHRSKRRISGLTYILAALALAIALGAASPFTAHLAAAPARQEAPLRVVTKKIEPFVFTDEPDPTGFSIDVWDAVADELGLDYEFIYVDKVGEQIDALVAGEADLALAAITITREREEAVDFSLPYFRSGLGIMTRTDLKAPLWESLIETILSPRLLGLFALLIGALIIAAHVIWLVERGRNPDFPQDYLHGIWEGIWWAAVTVTTVGYGDKYPKNRLGRLIGILWMFTGLFLIANFTAGVTAQLALAEIQGVINGPSDLPGKRVIAVEGSTGSQWLTDEGILHTNAPTLDDAIAALRAGSAEALVYDSPVLQYQVLNDPTGELAMAGSSFRTETYGIALPHDSDLREPINQALLGLLENGTYDRIYNTWFGSVNTGQ